MKIDNNFVFLLFTPGVGGNHLTNLLSISLNIFANLPDNKEDIINSYTKPEVKFNRHNLRKKYFLKTISNNTKQHDVMMCGHFSEYLFLENFFKKVIKNKKFISVTELDEKSIGKLKNRLKFIGDNYDIIENEYYLHEQGLIYSSHTLSKLLDCKKEDIVEVKLNDLLSENIIPVLKKIGNSLGYTEFSCLEFCQELHTIWLKNNNII
jgi:hypothetical protein